MIVPRRHSTDDYRYGFQGQEKDDEIKGDKGNSLNYTFRMHDPRAGRFFAVDPLAPQYPHNSPYAFSENRVIDAIELEGLEKLLVAKMSNPEGDTPGRAKITIKMDYQIMVDNPMGGLEKNSVDPKSFNERYKKGNYVDYAITLPSSSTEAQFLEGDHLKWAAKANNLDLSEAERTKYSKKLVDAGVTSYYKIDIEYDVNIQEQETIEGLIDFMKTAPQSKGIIMNKMDRKGKLRYLYNAASVRKDDGLKALVTFADRLNSKFSPVTGGAAISEGYLGLPDYNFIYINDERDGIELSLMDIIVHESGHNMSASHQHGQGKYEYTQNGLQSNKSDQIKPTPENSREIINDNTNRQTIK